jgi:cytochrome c-type biogenesis protein CcmF
VFNKIVGFISGKENTFTPLAFGEDSAHAYNRIQVFVAIILGAFTGFGMYLKYKSTGRPFLKNLLWPSLAGLVLAAVILAFGDVNYYDKGLGYRAAVWVAVAAAAYSMVTNGMYIFSGVKGKMKKAGGPIAHFGFAMMLLGILISSSKKEVLSYNTSRIPVYFGKDSKENPGENLTLVKNLKSDMGDYWVTYEKDSVHPKKPLWYYHLNFERKDGGDRFTLTPNAFVNYKGNMGLMANPDAKHYLTYDIFTYITSLPDPTKNKDTASFTPVPARAGDTVYYSNGYLEITDLKATTQIPGVDFVSGDTASVATIRVTSKTGSIYTIRPVLIEKGGGVIMQPDSVMAESLVLQLQKVEGENIELGLKESKSVMEYVTLKAYKFPFINLLWLGTILMVLGFFMSMLNRREKKELAAKTTGRETLVAERSAV